MAYALTEFRISGIKLLSVSATDCNFDNALSVFLLSRDLRNALIAFSCFLPNESSIRKSFCFASTSSANLFTPTRILESSSTSFLRRYAFCLRTAHHSPPFFQPHLQCYQFPKPCGAILDLFYPETF